MSHIDFFAPFVPLHYRFFQTEPEMLECDGLIYASDALCDSGNIEKVMPTGRYYCGYEYADAEHEQWTGIWFIHQNSYSDFLNNHLTVEQPCEEENFVKSFFVDSGTAMFILDAAKFKTTIDYEFAYERDKFDEGWQNWGWQGYTALGDGAYPIEMILDENHHVVGCRIDFVGIEEEQYLQMVEDGLIEYNELLFNEHFAIYS
jgi:hypothetical protein